MGDNLWNIKICQKRPTNGDGGGTNKFAYTLNPPETGKNMIFIANI